jgi:hypothetical protein
LKSNPGNKEFDNLFHQRYEGHESSPPAHLWEKVNSSFSGEEPEEFDNVVKERYSGHKKDAPEQLWGHIDGQVETMRTATLIKRNNYYKRAVIALLLLLGLLITYSQFNNHGTDNREIDNTIEYPTNNMENTDIGDEPISDNSHSPLNKDQNSSANIEKGELSSSNSPGSTNTHLTSPQQQSSDNNSVVTYKKEENQNHSTSLNESFEAFAKEVHDDRVNSDPKVGENNTLVLEEQLDEIIDSMKAKETVVTNEDEVKDKFTLYDSLPPKAHKTLASNMTFTKRFYISAFYIHTYNYGIFKSKRAGVRNYFGEKTSEKVQNFGFDVGLNFSKNWSLSLGAQTNKFELTYNKVGRFYHLPMRVDAQKKKITTRSMFGETVTSPESTFEYAPQGTDPKDTAKFYKFRYGERIKFSTINIPVIVDYKIRIGKAKIMLRGGIIASRITKSESIIKIATEKKPRNVIVIRDYHKARNTGISTVTGIGVSYGLGRHFSILVSPTYTYTLTSLNKNSSNKFKPNSMYISTGVRYNF